jgi:hypothetical protein
VAQCTHRAFEALPAGVNSQPLPGGWAASACCNEIVTATVMTTTPSNPSAATMAIMAIDTFLSSRDEWFILLANLKKLFLLSISTCEVPSSDNFRAYSKKWWRNYLLLLCQKNQFSSHLLSKEKKNKRRKKEQAIEDIADRHSKVSYSD